MRAGKAPAGVPDLDDPLVMGEDLQELAQRVAEVSEVYCTDCGGSHKRWLQHRIGEEKASFHTHFPELVGAVLQAISLLHERGASRLNMMIAGCADTGLLALCAHVARAQRVVTQEAVRIHVVDQCRTPLVLCDEFAARHGLPVTTQHCRIPDEACGFTADLVLADSLLRYFSSERQPDVIDYLASSQEKGGMLVYGQILARIPAMVERPGSTDVPDPIRQMLGAAGYEFEQEILSDRDYRLSSGAKRHVRRYVAVATKSK